jgi:hypothetical protein
MNDFKYVMLTAKCAFHAGKLGVTDPVIAEREQAKSRQNSRQNSRPGAGEISGGNSPVMERKSRGLAGFLWDEKT